MKKFIIMLLLSLSLIFSDTAQAIDSSDLILYIGKRVEFSVLINLENSYVHIHVPDALILNVINGMELFDNIFADYYIVFKMYSDITKEGSKPLLLPVTQMTYIKELNK